VSEATRDTAPALYYHR